MVKEYARTVALLGWYTGLVPFVLWLCIHQFTDRVSYLQVATPIWVIYAACYTYYLLLEQIARVRSAGGE